MGRTLHLGVAVCQVEHRRSARRPAGERHGQGSGRRPGGMDPAWEELRRQVRERMTTTGIGYAALGQAIGRSANTTRIALCRHKPAASALAGQLAPGCRMERRRRSPTRAGFAPSLQAERLPPPDGPPRGAVSIFAASDEAAESDTPISTPGPSKRSQDRRHERRRAGACG